MRVSFRYQSFLLLLCLLISVINVIASGSRVSVKKTILDAPHTWIGSANPCQPTQLSFPVIDSNFNNITSISLRLDYNPSGLAYDTFSNVNSQLSGLVVNDNHVSDTLHKLIIVWSDINPKSIPNGQSLVTLVFNFTGGATYLTWNNTASGGSDCEYGDANGDPMNDLPTDLYYHKGYVEGGAVGPAGTVNGSNEVCQGDENVIYSVTPVVNASRYVWTIPPGSDIISGAGTNEIHLHFSSSAASGDVQVYGAAGNCTGTLSPPFWVTVKNQPEAPSITISGGCLLSNYSLGNQWYDSTGIIAGASDAQYCPVKTGYYSDRATLNACTSLPSNWIYVFVSGIRDYCELINSCKVWPNPAKDFITVEFQLNTRADGGVKIMDIVGREIGSIPVQRFEKGNSKVIIQTRELPEGLYTLKISFTSEWGQKQYLHKLIITR